MLASVCPLCGAWFQNISQASGDDLLQLWAFGDFGHCCLLPTPVWLLGLLAGAGIDGPLALGLARMASLRPSRTKVAPA